MAKPNGRVALKSTTLKSNMASKKNSDGMSRWDRAAIFTIALFTVLVVYLRGTHLSATGAHRLHGVSAASYVSQHLNMSSPFKWSCDNVDLKKILKYRTKNPDAKFVAAVTKQARRQLSMDLLGCPAFSSHTQSCRVCQSIRKTAAKFKPLASNVSAPFPSAMNTTNLCPPCNKKRGPLRFIKNGSLCTDGKLSNSDAETMRQWFFSRLNDASVRYVVTPGIDIDLGQDLKKMEYNDETEIVYETSTSRVQDILFQGEDEKKFHFLLSKKRMCKNSPAFRMYSDRGAHGSAYGAYGVDVPFIQPHLAKRVLDDAVPCDASNAGCYQIPSNSRYSWFLSLAYHIVYHHGESSGIPARAGTPINSDAGHRHVAMLLESAPRNELRAASNITLEILLSVLTKYSFRPSLDLARKYVEYAPIGTNATWLESKFPPAEEKSALHANRVNGSLTVFVVRELSYNRGITNNFIDAMRCMKLIPIKVLNVRSTKEQRRIALRVRGGVWDGYPYALSGGLPSAAVVVWDPYPALPESVRTGWTYLTNSHMQDFKYVVRTAYNTVVRRKYYQLFTHCSDDDNEAWEYIDAFASQGEKEEISSTVEKLRQIWLSEEGKRVWEETKFPHMANITGDSCA
eukprot:m.407183 g.407183  ORF g.407183 m.407183 type:complete len:627 (+) comp21220_c0_seq1:476-2356(+)